MSTDPSDDHFMTLLLANQSRVYRFLFTLVPRHEDVEDLFQQTCLTLWLQRAKFDPEKGAFASWACAIAQNHVRNFRRRESTRHTLLSEEVAELLVTNREAGGRFSEECHQALQHCLNQLPSDQKTLVEESYREGAPQEHGGCGQAIGQCPLQEPAADPGHPARLHVESPCGRRHLMNADQAARLRDGADAYVEGTLGPAEREALERELLTSAEARRFFLSYLELHAGLAWPFRGLECEMPVPSDANPTRASTLRRWRWSLSSGACVI